MPAPAADPLKPVFRQEGPLGIDPLTLQAIERLLGGCVEEMLDRHGISLKTLQSHRPGLLACTMVLNGAVFLGALECAGVEGVTELRERLGINPLPEELWEGVLKADIEGEA